MCKTFEDVFILPKFRNDDSTDSGLGLKGASCTRRSDSLLFRGIFVLTYLQVTMPPSRIYPYELPDSRDASLTSAVTSPPLEADYSPKVFFVKGAKKSGKSTFAKTLLNLLTT